MDAPDPEGLSLLAKVIAAGAPLVAAVWGFFKLWNKKADKHTVANQLQAVQNELALHRGYFKDVFNKIEANEKISEARHRELLMHLMRRGEQDG